MLRPSQLIFGHLDWSVINLTHKASSQKQQGSFLALAVLWSNLLDFYRPWTGDCIYSRTNIDFYLKLLFSFPGATPNHMSTDTMTLSPFSHHLLDEINHICISPSNLGFPLAFPSDDPFSDPVLLNITFLDYGRPEFCSLPDELLPDSLRRGSNPFWFYLPGCIPQLFYFCLQLLFLPFIIRVPVRINLPFCFCYCNNFTHTGLVASFCIVFILTMKTSGMSLHAVEFDNFFSPLVKLLGEWGEKHGTMIFRSSKLTVRPACPEALSNLRYKEASFRAFVETWKNVSQPSYADLPMRMKAT